MQADSYVFNSSVEAQDIENYFLNKKWVHLQDEQNGSYSGGQITFSTSSLSNSGLYQNLSEAVIDVPLVISLTADDATSQLAGTALQDTFAVGLKNGINIFHSIQVEYNNQTLVQLTPFANHYVNFRMLTKMSDEDVKKWGDYINFHPDHWQSHSFFNEEPVAGVAPATTLGGKFNYGFGSVNNRTKSSSPSSANVASYNAFLQSKGNEGLLERQVNTSYSPFSSGTTPANDSFYLSNAVVAQEGDAYCSRDGNKQHWFCIAHLRLKDIAPVFEKMPLQRGAFLRITMNLNTSSQELRVYNNSNANVALGDKANSIAASVMRCTSSTLTNASSCVMINGDAWEDKFALLGVGSHADAEGVFTLSCSVGRDTINNVSNPVFTTCRLNCPLYQLDPSREQQYLSLSKTKTINYTDIYNYSVSVSCPGGEGSFQALLTNGLANLDHIVIIPYVAASGNNIGGTKAADGALTLGNPTAPYASPFTSEPSTSTPSIFLRNFQIQVGGANIFQNNEIYAWENFAHELAEIDALNGGMADGLTCGQISFKDFQGDKRYYVANLARRLPAEDGVAKSVSISGEVRCPAAYGSVQLMCFIAYRKSMAIDVSTGQLLSD